MLLTNDNIKFKKISTKKIQTYAEHRGDRPSPADQKLLFPAKIKISEFVKVCSIVRCSFIATVLHTRHVIMTKGVANQSCSNTFPSGQINVRLKPTFGAGVRSEEN